MSARLNILNAIKAIVAAATVTAQDGATFVLPSVELYRANAVDLDATPLPCVFIYPESEERAPEDAGAIGMEHWDLYVVLEVWTHEFKVATESLLKVIHDALGADMSLGGLCEWCCRQSSTIQDVDLERELLTFTMRYKIRYGHTQGVM